MWRYHNYLSALDYATKRGVLASTLLKVEKMAVVTPNNYGSVRLPSAQNSSNSATRWVLSNTYVEIELGNPVTILGTMLSVL